MCKSTVESIEAGTRGTFITFQLQTSNNEHGHGVDNRQTIFQQSTIQ